MKEIINIIQSCIVNNQVPVIAGPTASGKSELAYSISDYFDIEIISADSRQIYKYLDIGTAKPSEEILKKVPHRLISLITPDKNYSAAEFADAANKHIIEIFRKKKLPVIVGGTGLYIKTLFDGIFEGPERNSEIRANLESKSNFELYEILKKIDSYSSEKININDKKRLIRAIEVFELTGESITELKKNTKPVTEYKPFYIIMNKNRNELYDRINMRAEIMIRNGWIEETQKILDMGYASDCPAFEGLGYRDIIGYIEKKQKYDDMIENIKLYTRRYAKRQIIWFRHQLIPDKVI
ncbi:tRNA (adenosine(37)-N6)-dimethylallyltransferase MiaA [Candidatus Dependentiae bacterium]|nr:tRNA (adenosine(37)-N6)-dimethylallyltransferase MiaA [Candidatus Dependentiae bacterium]